jgi:hypothetical protein
MGEGRVGLREMAWEHSLRYFVTHQLRPSVMVLKAQYRLLCTGY